MPKLNEPCGTRTCSGYQSRKFFRASKDTVVFPEYPISKIHTVRRSCNTGNSIGLHLDRDFCGVIYGVVCRVIDDCPDEEKPHHVYGEEQNDEEDGECQSGFNE